MEADDGDPAAWSQQSLTWSPPAASPAIEAAARGSRSFLHKAVDDLRALRDNPYRHSLYGLCEFVVRRTY
jgi:octaprenyl-diphosphate synthase